MFADVLGPVDDSEGADGAIGHAVDLADRFEATVHVLFVAGTNRDARRRFPSG